MIIEIEGRGSGVVKNAIQAEWKRLIEVRRNMPMVVGDAPEFKQTINDRNRIDADIAALSDAYGQITRQEAP